ncbi:PAS domain S-box protein [Halogeometricum borinquense]|uniref:PAS domain S-box protein n=1 Tax=Halogeometricum borinquense TaxID=60847 RepID=A0A6C0UFF5_9EURY|nr:PAS domain S-box protein [Halogeometricum borinquense]QIB74182.1 PAS domain S-box protein [Halogeometricum borinquense]QIQ76611.1 PAS domain S-box protein [Halogeometricum borinquense]
MTPLSSRHRLYDIFADPERDIEAKIAQALDLGAEFFDLPIGFLTRIDDGIQEIVQSTGGHELIQPGETCPLDSAYCRLTVELDSPLAVQDAAASDISQQAIDTFGLGTYIGTKIVVQDETYGTVCFADTDERGTPFTDSEEMFLELLGKLVSRELERQAHDRELRGRNERLKREKQRFEAIAETSFDILFRVGLTGQFTYVSSAVERILGYSPAELTGEQFTDFTTEAAAEVAAEAYARVLDNQNVQNLELDLLDDTGSVVVLEVNATPVIEDGDVVGVQGVGRDVTDRKERQQELHIKNRAMDEAQVGISITDIREPNEPLIYVNEGFERVTGYSAEETLGRNLCFLQGEQTDPECAQRLETAIDAGDPVVVELINYRRDGTPFWNQIYLAPVDDETGEITHYVGFQQDVTERKRTEQLIQVLNRVLRHNLRNDMNALLGWHNHLYGSDSRNADVERRVERIAQGLLAMSERARELEQYARRERVPERLDPTVLLTAIVNEQREQWPNATIQLAIQTDRNICAGSELKQMVTELIENAIKHNLSNDPHVVIEVNNNGEWIDIVVSDNGPGIDEMEAKVVSEGGETPLQHSSGLGLWLVNWAVTRYGGSFRISATEQGDGTTATIRLPGIEDETPVDAVARRPTVLFA